MANERREQLGRSEWLCLCFISGADVCVETRDWVEIEVNVAVC